MSQLIDPALLGIESPIIRPTKGTKLPRHGPGEKFIAGPIPWRWLSQAAKLPGKTLHVGLAIWHLAFIYKTSEFKLSNVPIRELGITRKARYVALRRLENAGLIQCTSSTGQLPTVKILSPDL